MLAKPSLIWMLAAVSLVAACTVPVSGGLLGGLGAFAAIALAIGFWVTQSGCDSKEPPVGPCLSPMAVTPCLKVMAPDLEPPPTKPDVGVPEPDPAEIGPCLSLVAPLEHDMGAMKPLEELEQLEEATKSPELKRPEVKKNLEKEAKHHVGPCLSIRPDRPGPLKPRPKLNPCLSILPEGAFPLNDEPSSTVPPTQREILKKFGERLPADVIARLHIDNDEEQS